ncbi:MAG TPA: choice-of-anchor L domain-containing protein [Polyangia bacterium]|nr:choice-of-anchor L domain-containing protein [Polyangia bacterium]
MRNAIVSFSWLALLQLACGPNGSRPQGNHPGGGNKDMTVIDNGNGDGGYMPPPGCKSTGGDPNGDQDQDGYTPMQGDCDDCNPTINPGAIQIPGDPTDYACNGMPGVRPTCDTMNVGKNDATSLAAAFEQCDSRFFKSATLVGPSDTKARAVTPAFGSIKPQAGANMALLSTGLAVDKNGAGFVEPQIGTSLGCSNEFAHPLPNIMPNPACAASVGTMSCEPMMVKDYTELVVKLHAPTNANSFSFQFQFFSAEYPDFVCTIFNDEFLVLQESPMEFPQPTNISFDSNKNPITVNNGLFTVCQNGTMTYDMNCKQPVTMLAGTGYEDPASMSSKNPPPTCNDDYMSSCTQNPLMPGGDTSGGNSVPIGGSTGWLTTTAPVTPGEDVTLHFIIFDEGDHIYDSAVTIDNFQWGTTVIMTPSTGPIS